MLFLMNVFSFLEIKRLEERLNEFLVLNGFNFENIICICSFSC